MNINLNSSQKTAVQHKKGALLIIAGAGTGKTAVITQRILHIINSKWAKSNEILALTFTDKAAEEMLSRVDENLPLSYGDIWISTFHSFCDRILRQEGLYIRLDTNYSMMSSAQSYIFFRKHLFNFSLNRFRPHGNPTKFIDDILKHFSRLQDEDVSPSDYLAFAKKLSKRTREQKEEYEDILELATVYDEYTKLKIENSKIDFGDLIILAIRLFREKPNVLKKYKERFKYILVDEFQDTNHTQNVLVNILCGLDPKTDLDKVGKINPNLTVVGDDDQAIYKFRGAAISNILQFKQLYPKAREVVLTENYRSRQEILDASYSLISYNNPYRLEVTEKIEKRLISKANFEEDDDVVSLVVAQDEDSEAEWIAKEILKLTGYGEGSISERVQKFDREGQSSFVELIPDRKYKFSDIAILVRANAHADTVIKNLRYLGIPYKVGSSRGLYSRDEIKFLIAFLKVLVDYKDEISVYKLLTLPLWDISAREFIEINRLARESRVSVLEEIENLLEIRLGEVDSESIDTNTSNILNKILSEDARNGLHLLLKILDESFKRIKEGKSIGEILYNFVKESGYIESFLGEDSEQAQFKVSNISKFFSYLQDYEKNNSESNIYEYVDYLNYSIEIGESPLVDQMEMSDYDAVNILTVHSAKGLEFPCVFLVNLVSDRFPSQTRRDIIPIPEDLIQESLLGLGEKEEHLQEERRLFYVGATRAKEKLFLTAANFYGGARRKKKGSLFLYELLNRDVSDEFNNPKIQRNDKIGNIYETKEENILPKDINLSVGKRVSYSQINIYQDCPKKYEYAYVLQLPSKPSASMSFGTTVHNALKDFYNMVRIANEGLGLSGLPTIEDLIELFNKHWVSFGYESKKHEEKRYKAGEKMMRDFYKKLYKSRQVPYRLEESFRVNLKDSSFVGKVDRMDLVKIVNGVSHVEIIDYKTGKEKSKTDIKKDLQLPLYAIFAEQSFGVKVVSAKYVFVEHGSEIDVDISEKRRESASDNVYEVIENIKKRDFEATPDMFKCKYCDYRDICKDAIL